MLNFFNKATRLEIKTASGELVLITIMYYYFPAKNYCLYCPKEKENKIKQSLLLVAFLLDPVDPLFFLQPQLFRGFAFFDTLCLFISFCHVTFWQKPLFTIINLTRMGVVPILVYVLPKQAPEWESYPSFLLTSLQGERILPRI